MILIEYQKKSKGIRYYKTLLSDFYITLSDAEWEEMKDWSDIHITNKVKSLIKHKLEED